MPEAPASKPEPYSFTFDTHASTTESTPAGPILPTITPNGPLICHFVSRCLSRYGAHELSHCTPSEFLHLHSTAISAVRRAFFSARVGGPEIADGPGDGWLYAFLNHTATTNAPLDFISFHAKGDPRYIDNSHICMNLSAQLQNVDQAFGNICMSPAYKHLPTIIGEQDPNGCAACLTPSYDYRNGISIPLSSSLRYPRDGSIQATGCEATRQSDVDF